MRFIYYIYSLIFVLSVVSGPHKGLLKYSLNLSDSQHCLDMNVYGYPCVKGRVVYLAECFVLYSVARHCL